MKSRKWLGVVCLGIGLWLVGIALAGTSDVFRVKALIQGKIEFFTTINKVKISRDELINLARGRDLRSVVPPNEVLAFTSVCDTNDMKIIVFDTLTSSNLATIGRLDVVNEVSQFDKHELIAQFTVPGAGGISNALTGGTLLMDAAFTVDRSNCVTKWSGTMLGVLGTLVPATNFIPILTTNIVDILTTNIACCLTNVMDSTTNVTCCTTNIMDGMTNLVDATTNIVETVLTNVSITGTITNFTPTEIGVLIPKTKFSAQGKKIGTLIEEP